MLEAPTRRSTGRRTGTKLRLHQLEGQPVEEFRMRRDRALLPKITGRADEALAEMVLPETVYHDTSRKWIRRIANPEREGKAALLIVSQGVVESRLGGVRLF